MPPAYSHLYIKEYGEAALAAKYGPTGRIPYQPNNTIVETRYEPEYARYGGVRGVAIAEQHFHASSTLALNVMGSANGHDFRVILGHSLSFFLLTCFALLPPEAWVHFCEHYEARWSRSNPNINDVSRKAFQAKYARQRSQIRKKVAQCWAAHQCGAASGLLDQTRKTLDSLSRDLRSALPEIRGQLATPEPASDLDHVFFLMTSYIHMHNNRLGLFNLDEVYVAYVSKHALREFWPSTAAANGAPSPLATLAA